jgi:hypothetical protein
MNKFNKRMISLLVSVFFSFSIFAQQKGLLISEILTNPNGNDSPFEYVELLATTNINFATTPYSIVFTDNGTATSNGWKAGSSVTYAFSISTGSVTAGQVVYVGGSSMAPLSNGGVALRVKNTGSTGGDNFGSSNSGGVLGNGGSNCDGVAVFNVSAANVTSSRVPVDAIFFGNQVGTAYRNSTSGYQMPVNDKYNGGKLSNSIYLAPDPGADQLVKATTGVYNPTTNTFTTPRTFIVTTTPSYNSTSITLTSGTSNTAPTITLATPTVSGNAPATVSLSATAADVDGTISRVEFFNGTTLLNTDVSSPYSFSWTNVAAGTYSITAKATDNLNAVSTSSVINITVNASGNTAPTITLATPTVSGNAPATVSLSATAADVDGTISRVEFFNGTTLLNTDVSSPYSFSWTNVAAGTYSITAKATDNLNAVTTSSVINITVNASGNTAPTITLATPTVSGNAPATVSLSATAADVDGTISRVEFFNGTTLLNTDVSSPYSFSWTNVAAGTYSITAKATDNLNAVTTSSVRVVTVNSSVNAAPTLSFNTTASKYVNLSSGIVSCVMNNATDPVIVTGLDINVGDENLNTVVFSMTSSNTSVVPNGNFTIVGTGSARKFKINPTGVGYSTITLRVTDAQGLNRTITLSLAVSASLATSSIKDIYNTGVADGSTGIAVDANYMFVADDETNVIKLFNRNNSGLSVYQFDVNPYLNLSGTEVDIEGSFRSTTNPNRIYWIGSLSNSKTGQARPDRNRIFATDIVGTGANATLVFVGYYGNLRSRLITWGDANGYNFTAKAATGIEPKRIDGFNVEGLEMGPDGTTLYIGFRAPYVGSGNNKAVICPLLNFESWFGNGSPTANPTFGAPIVLNLNNHGIRSLGKNASNQYIIVAGSYAAEGTFELYSWNGQPASAPVLLTANLSNLKPEGIVEIPSSLTGSFQVDLISDLGSNIIYNDAIENKAVAQANHRKFLTSTIVVTSNSGARMAFIDTKEEVGSLSSLIAFPNPTNYSISIEVPQTVQEVGNYSIFSMNGSLVKTGVTATSDKTITLDLSDLKNGIYLIRIDGIDGFVKALKQ